MKKIVLPFIIATVCVTGCADIYELDKDVYEQHSKVVKLYENYGGGNPLPQSDVQIRGFIRSYSLSSSFIGALQQACSSAVLNYERPRWKKSTEAIICNAVPGTNHP